jgi:hypothetical protein
MNLTFNFGGFYQGIHQQLIESLIDQDLEYRQDNVEFFDEDKFYDSIDYSKTYLEYTKVYVKHFFSSILSGYNIKLTIKPKNISISSPKEYNFATDVIILTDVSKTTVKNLTRLFNYLVEDDNKFRDFIKYKTTSRDGYIPYYTYDEIINKKELDVSLEMLLEYLNIDYLENCFSIEDLYCLIDDLELIYK